MSKAGEIEGKHRRPRQSRKADRKPPLAPTDQSRQPSARSKNAATSAFDQKRPQRPERAAHPNVSLRERGSSLPATLAVGDPRQNQVHAKEPICAHRRVFIRPTQAWSPTRKQVNDHECQRQRHHPCSSATANRLRADVEHEQSATPEAKRIGEIEGLKCRARRQKRGQRNVDKAVLARDIPKRPATLPNQGNGTEVEPLVMEIESLAKTREKKQSRCRTPGQTARPTVTP